MDLEAAEEFSVAVGTPLDPALGIIFMYVFDCNGVPAEGLQFRSDQADNPWYVVNGIPNFTTRATSPQGVGGFANVPPGVALVQSSFGDGTPLGRPQAVYVRPGWGTVVIIDPSGSAPGVARP